MVAAVSAFEAQIRAEAPEASAPAPDSMQASVVAMEQTMAVLNQTGDFAAFIAASAVLLDSAPAAPAPAPALAGNYLPSMTHLQSEAMLSSSSVPTTK